MSSVNLPYDIIYKNNKRISIKSVLCFYIFMSSSKIDFDLY